VPPDWPRFGLSYQGCRTPYESIGFGIIMGGTSLISARAAHRLASVARLITDKLVVSLT
jgi:hypothetical protein